VVAFVLKTENLALGLLEINTQIVVCQLHVFYLGLLIHEIRLASFKAKLQHSDFQSTFLFDRPNLLPQRLVIVHLVSEIKFKFLYCPGQVLHVALGLCLLLAHFFVAFLKLSLFVFGPVQLLD